MNNEVKIVVGSWYAYNNCNAKALGSEWICLNDFEEWEEIEAELTKQGFVLNGEDEELFIQDIECEADFRFNCDLMHPKTLFELLKESEVLDDEYKFKVCKAYIEVCSWRDFVNLVESRGSRWDDDIILWENMDMVDVAQHYVDECYDLPEIAQRYFDYEAFARDLSYDGFYEVEDGVIEIR